MKSLFLLCFSLSISGLAADPEWKTLFDGKTLTGWKATSDADWRVEDGTIVVGSGQGGFLVHEDSYANYELEVEFKAARGANSGVFLSTKEIPKSLTKDCYELNIAPPENPFPTGSLVARAKVEGAGESDEWRRFEVRVVGNQVRVVLDGKRVLDHQADPIPDGTRISLQKNQGRVAFRNLRVRKLP